MYAGSAYAAAPYAGSATSGSGGGGTPVSSAPDDLHGIPLAGKAFLTVDVPVAALPAGLSLGTRVEKALAYPTPVLVDGRPT